MSEDFFEEPLEQSKVKGQIVADYFPAWANIILRWVDKIGFVDLYAGPGKYKYGTHSTPLLILNNAVRTPKLAKSLVCIFNDKDSKSIDLLDRNIAELPGIDKLAFRPTLLNLEVSDEILNALGNISGIPTLFFLDPWGYKGLSLKLLKSSISSWGSECLFFFNYNRINMSLKNLAVQKDINALFSKGKADGLRKDIWRLAPYDREITIVNELCKALKEMGGVYVIPFCFKAKSKNRTSHYLIFVGKHERGYGLMKEIMANHCEVDADGVPSFTFDPKPKKQLEFTFNRPLVELKNSLRKDFQGQTLRVKAIYNNNQKRTRFIKKNYKDALIMLEKESKIEVDKPLEERRVVKGKITLGDDRIVRFN